MAFPFPKKRANTLKGRSHNHTPQSHHVRARKVDEHWPIYVQLAVGNDFGHQPPFFLYGLSLLDAQILLECTDVAGSCRLWAK